jgi:hypothetical protein
MKNFLSSNEISKEQIENYLTDFKLQYGLTELSIMLKKIVNLEVSPLTYQLIIDYSLTSLSKELSLTLSTIFLEKHKIDWRSTDYFVRVALLNNYPLLALCVLEKGINSGFNHEHLSFLGCRIAEQLQDHALWYRFGEDLQFKSPKGTQGHIEILYAMQGLPNLSQTQIENKAIENFQRFPNDTNIILTSALCLNAFNESTPKNLEICIEICNTGLAIDPINVPLKEIKISSLIKLGDTISARKEMDTLLNALDPHENHSPLLFKLLIKLNGIYDANKLINEYYNKKKSNREIIIRRSDNTNETNYILISGTARSGTSALGYLLNGSDQVGVFHEVFDENHILTPNDFLISTIKERIDILNSTDSYNNQLLERKELKFVGHKIPFIYRRLPAILQNFNSKNLIILIIVRDLQEILYSAEHRATNYGDLSWPRNNDSFYMIHEINHFFKLMNTYLSNPKLLNGVKLQFVHFNDLFGDLKKMHSVFTDLGINISNTVVDRINSIADENAILHSRRAYANKNKLISRKVKRALSYLDLVQFDIFKKLTQLKVQA